MCLKSEISPRVFIVEQKFVRTKCIYIYINECSSMQTIHPLVRSFHFGFVSAALLLLLLQTRRIYFNFHAMFGVWFVQIGSSIRSIQYMRCGSLISGRLLHSPETMLTITWAQSGKNIFDHQMHLPFETVCIAWVICISSCSALNSVLYAAPFSKPIFLFIYFIDSITWFVWMWMLLWLRLLQLLLRQTYGPTDQESQWSENAFSFFAEWRRVSNDR